MKSELCFTVSIGIFTLFYGHKGLSDRKKDMINSCFRNKKAHISLVICPVTLSIEKNSSFITLMTH